MEQSSGRSGFLLYFLLIAALALSGRAPAAQETPAPVSGLQRAIEEVRGVHFREALAAAVAEPDQLLRAQAELFVYHQAGALDAALQAGLQGLALAPEDPWLLEQTAFVALTLGLGTRAADCLAVLQRVAPGSSPEWMAPRAQELQGLRESERAALQRAQRVALGLFVLLGLALAALALK